MGQIWQRMTGRGSARRLVLHVGLPKCASSAIQAWADSNRPWLLENGVDYPPATVGHLYPKHQFLVNMLLANRVDQLRQAIRSSKAETLFLSTEGLSNHFHDYSPEVLSAFRGVVKGLAVSVVFVQRDPEDWARALYKQAVLNPPVEAYLYATTLPFAVYRSQPRVTRMVDFDLASAQIAQGYGASDLIRINIQEGWLDPLAAHLGVTGNGAVHAPSARNVSPSDTLIELVRQANGLGLEDDTRAEFLALVQMSEKSGHSLLMSQLTTAQGRPVHHKRLSDCVSRLAPSDAEASAMIDRLRASLASLGPSW